MNSKRKLLDGNCSACNKDGIFCKGVCQACYSKQQRNTDEGRKRTAIYNQVKGKEAQARWRAKQPKKEPRYVGIKQDCACGKPSIAKGFCMNCYYIERRKKLGFTIRHPKTKQGNKEIYNLVLRYVLNGDTISAACKKIKINRHFFYESMNEAQKKELNLAKALNRNAPKFDDID